MSTERELIAKYRCITKEDFIDYEPEEYKDRLKNLTGFGWILTCPLCKEAGCSVNSTCEKCVLNKAGRVMECKCLLSSNYRDVDRYSSKSIDLNKLIFSLHKLADEFETFLNENNL